MTGAQQLRPGLKLSSTVCSVQVIVVRPPASRVTVTCGGQPLAAEGQPPAADGETGGLLLGKRYVDGPSGLELLCTRAGTGPLAADGRELTVKAARPLPSSD